MGGSKVGIIGADVMATEEDDDSCVWPIEVFCVTLELDVPTEGLVKCTAA